MQIIKNRSALTPAISQLKSNGKTIGFVPTMGALHEGHISLIVRAKADCDVVVCSIFVNPTQFTDAKDLEKYPRPVEEDIKMLQDAGCDILYLPDEKDIYPYGKTITNKFDFGALENMLEGASRPGHFAGVAQVVKILLEIVQPNILFLGQKDYQQYIILKKLVETQRLNIEVKKCPIIREENGLAMSSRNSRLSSELRFKAGIIYATLNYAASLIKILPFAEIETSCFDAMNALDDFEVDYFEILNAENLSEIKIDTKEIVIVTSVIAGGVRLLDNVVV
ncbi:MAG: pantoate--beta-alanine ligase [Fimbriimonadaceae bacterium]|nr:pantoate--beta-alanine ligase [Chitinophagales bacterium]